MACSSDGGGTSQSTRRMPSPTTKRAMKRTGFGKADQPCHFRHGCVWRREMAAFCSGVNTRWDRGMASLEGLMTTSVAPSCGAGSVTFQLKQDSSNKPYLE